MPLPAVRRDRQDTARFDPVSELRRRRTRTVGAFHFELTVPDDIDPEQVQADLDHGVLTVRLPKPAGTAPRRIQID